MKELFLICALALPPLSVPNHVYGFPTYRPNLYRLMSREQAILIVGGSPVYVHRLRQERMKAFGALTDDWLGTTIWHAVCDIGKLSFQSHSFDSVWVRMENPLRDPGYRWLTDIVRLVQPGGFLLFNDEHFPMWGEWLYRLGFERVPLNYKEYQIWHKFIGSDVLIRSSA